MSNIDAIEEAFKIAYYWNEDPGNSHLVFQEQMSKIGYELTLEETKQFAENIARDGIVINLYQEGV